MFPPIFHKCCWCCQVLWQKVSWHPRIISLSSLYLGTTVPIKYMLYASATDSQRDCRNHKGHYDSTSDICYIAITDTSKWTEAQATCSHKATKMGQWANQGSVACIYSHQEQVSTWTMAQWTEYRYIGRSTFHYVLYCIALFYYL